MPQSTEIGALTRLPDAKAVARIADELMLDMIHMDSKAGDGMRILENLAACARLTATILHATGPDPLARELFETFLAHEMEAAANETSGGADR